MMDVNITHDVTILLVWMEGILVIIHMSREVIVQASEMVDLKPISFGTLHQCLGVDVRKYQWKTEEECWYTLVDGYIRTAISTVKENH